MMDANTFHPLMADYGRGPQLRSCRITVNDLVPYLRHADYSDEQMRTWWPMVTLEELAALKSYIAANFDEVMAENDRVDARIAREVEAQYNDPVLQAKFAESHKRFELKKEWHAARNKNPGLFRDNPNDTPEEHRKRLNHAFDQWLAGRTPSRAEAA